MNLSALTGFPGRIMRRRMGFREIAQSGIVFCVEIASSFPLVSYPHRSVQKSPLPDPPPHPTTLRDHLAFQQLAARLPNDLPGDDFTAKYKGLRPPFDHWSHVADVCGKLSDQLLAHCVEALRADASPAVQQAQTTIDTWREARAAGETPPPGKLPGLAR
ncbi:MAG: hypothetical protein ACREFT_06135 [Acetobacteraceae bacterium]